MMGESPSSDENGLKKGPWTPEEDQKLVTYIQRNGHGSWRALPKLAGLNRCGKSCRLRWTNYLRPDIKRGKFSEEEEQLIIKLHSVLGNKWSAIATRLPGRTDNEIKNFWNTHLKKKLLQMGIDPVTHRPRTDLNFLTNLPRLLGAAGFGGNSLNPWDINALKFQYSDATQLAKIQLLHNILQVLITTPTPNVEALSLLGSVPFQDHQLYELLQQSSHEFQGQIGNSSSDFALHSNSQIPSNFPNLEAPQGPYNHQPMQHSKAFSGNGDNNNNNQLDTSYAMAVANSIPALVSASPERSTAAQVENKDDPISIANPSCTSNTFETWSELMDDEESCDPYWREIMHQASSPSWPISS